MTYEEFFTFISGCTFKLISYCGETRSGGEWIDDPADVEASIGDFWIDEDTRTCGFSKGQYDQVSGYFIPHDDNSELIYQYRR